MNSDEQFCYSTTQCSPSAPATAYVAVEVTTAHELSPAGDAAVRWRCCRCPYFVRFADEMATDRPSGFWFWLWDLFGIRRANDATIYSFF